MTDLALAESEPAPRSDAVTHQLSLRIAPAGGFLLRGMLWASLSCGAAALTGGTIMAVSAAVIQRRPLPLWLGALAGGLALAALVAAWMPFVWHVKSRRAAARRLARDGILCDATTSDVMTTSFRGRYGRVYGSSFWLSFSAEGAEHQLRTQLRGPASTIARHYRVLYGAGNCVAFAQERVHILKLDQGRSPA